MKAIKNIAVFGDSILKGIQLNVENMRYHVDNHIDVDGISARYSLIIRNFSKFGCTAAKGFAMIQSRLCKSDPSDMIVMDYGGNDCDFAWTEISENPDREHQPNVPLEKFKQIYRQIIETIKEHGVVPVLTTLPPLESQRFFDWFCGNLNKERVLNWLGGTVDTIFRHQESYSKAVEELAREMGTYLVDIRSAFLANGGAAKLMCADGIHPNTAGQRIITSEFVSFAEKLKLQRALAT
ncbi:MAG: SGNH/GDSL hydrolase family protein [Oscillospiraceae bacterium]|jgi:lysophospholipase L1-like esterase|nr:SGNH/GDSL hydrolase family protein [Oscillospiraceae bacterium]